MTKKMLLLLFLAVPAYGFMGGFAHPKLPTTLKSTDAVEDRIKQLIDHDRPLDTRTFSQRYYKRIGSIRLGGPIFLFLGGEAESWGGYVSNESFIGQMTDRMNGAAFELEHRYYGISQPFDTLETQNLQYLSIDQALADAAYFAQQMVQIYGFSGPWIVCGFSYSGMLAGFARQKYPHIFHAAYSSSGQQEAKIDFFEYHEMTGIGLGKVNPLCPGYLSAAMDEMVARVTSQNQADVQFVAQAFNLCPESNLKIANDAMGLYSLVANVYGWVVQFALPGMIATECELLIDGPGTPLLNLAEVVNQAFPSGCLDVHYDGIVEFYKNSTQIEPGNNYRQHLYQTCLELGWYFTLSGNTPFGNVVPVEYYINMCADVFGELFTQELQETGVARTNLEFGGKTPDVTRTIFTHGTFDGWSKVAAETDINPDAPVIVIQDVGHAADVFFSANEPPQLIEARQQVEAQLSEWILLHDKN